MWIAKNSTVSRAVRITFKEPVQLLIGPDFDDVVYGITAVFFCPYSLCLKAFLNSEEQMIRSLVDDRDARLELERQRFEPETVQNERKFSIESVADASTGSDVLNHDDTGVSALARRMLERAEVSHEEGCQWFAWVPNFGDSCGTGDSREQACAELLLSLQQQLMARVRSLRSVHRPFVFF